MGWMDAIGGLIKQFEGGNAAPGQVEQQYNQMTQNTPASMVANGLAAAMRSDQTPNFGQIAAQMFGGANGNQQASMLNTLLATAGPALLSGALSGGSLPGLSSILGGAPRQLTPDEAAQVPAEEIQHLANHVQNHDPSIIDRMSELYAEHPALVTSIGSSVLSYAMAHIAQRSQA